MLFRPRAGSVAPTLRRNLLYGSAAHLRAFPPTISAAPAPPARDEVLSQPTLISHRAKRMAQRRPAPILPQSPVRCQERATPSRLPHPPGGRERSPPSCRGFRSRRVKVHLRGASPGLFPLPYHQRAEAAQAASLEQGHAHFDAGIGGHKARLKPASHEPHHCTEAGQKPQDCWVQEAGFMKESHSCHHHSRAQQGQQEPQPSVAATELDGSKHRQGYPRAVPYPPRPKVLTHVIRGEDHPFPRGSYPSNDAVHFLPSASPVRGWTNPPSFGSCHASAPT